MDIKLKDLKQGDVFTWNGEKSCIVVAEYDGGVVIDDKDLGLCNVDIEMFQNATSWKRNDEEKIKKN